MTVAPDPQEIYERSATEGQRRLAASTLETVSTGFTAGFTIVFGIVAFGVVDGLVAPAAGDEVAKLAGALAFGIGLVFAVVARADLFTENFLDPVAAVLEHRPGATWARVAWFWIVILALNLVGGAALALLLTVEGVLTPTAPPALVTVAEEILARPLLPSFTNAIVAGALLTLMTYLLQATGSVGQRMVIAYLVGFLVAINPFNHVVVTVLHLVVGLRFGAAVSLGEIVGTGVISAIGNVVGGVLFVTVTQTARALGSR